MRKFLALLACSGMFTVGAAITLIGPGAPAQAVQASSSLQAQTSGFMKNIERLDWAPAAGASGYSLVKDGVTVATAGPNATWTRFSVPAGQHTLAVYANQTPTTTSTSGTTTAATTTTSPVTTTGPVTTTAPVTTTTPVTTAPSTAAVTLSAAGNDSTCARNGSPCRTFNRAFQVAQPGDWVNVNGGGGAYTADYPAEGAVKILPSAKGPLTDDVTFVCGDGLPVTFASPADQLVITAQHVTIRGGCFRLNRLWVGDGANGVSTDDVTVDGVTMWSFDVAGSSNVTIENSQVGPSVACYAPGSSASCHNDDSTNEGYWYRAGRDNTSYSEPKVHTGGATGAVNPVNVLLLNDRFVQIQTRDSASLHTGCLWLGWTAGGSVTVRGSTFTGCAIYDIHIDQPSSWGLTLDGNTFHHSVEPVETGSNWTQETAVGQTDVQLKCQNGMTVSGYTLTNNSFEHGWDLDFGGCSSPTYTNLVLSGNTGGTIRNPASS